MPVPPTNETTVGIGSFRSLMIGTPVVSIVKLYEIRIPFSAVTLSAIPEPSSRFLILLTVPSISRTGTPVTEPSCSMEPVTPRPARKLS